MPQLQRDPRGHRRAALLVLAPILLGLLYVAGHALWSRPPTLEQAPPADTAWLTRYRNAATFGVFGSMRAPPGPDGQPPAPAAWLGALGERINVPDLVGLDARRPLVHLRRVPLGPIPRDALLLPLADGERFERRFREHGLDRGTPRHAQYLKRFGDLGVVAAHRETLSHIGEQGLTVADEGEDIAVAADMGRLLTLAFAEVGGGTFDPFLRGLGVDLDTPHPPTLSPEGLPQVTYAGTGRVGRVAAAWETARAWIHLGDEATLPRAHVELVLRPGPLADAWRTGLAGVAPARTWTPPPEPDLGLVAEVAGGTSRRLLRTLAYHLGADVPEPLAGDEVDDAAPSYWAAMRARGRSSDAWVVMVEEGVAPSPASFGLVAPATEDGVPADERAERTVAQWRLRAEGHEAERAASRVAAHLAVGGAAVRDAVPDGRPGRRLVRALLTRRMSWELLGPTLFVRGALLAPLDGRPLVVDVRATDGGIEVFVDVHDS